MSIRVRSDLVKRMAQLYPEANWNEVIETVCVWGLRLSREGEPVVRLTEAVEIQPPQPLLQPLVVEPHPTVIFAPGGSGKSLLALAAAMAVERGSGFAGIEALGAGPVLYLDFESDEADLRYRAQLLRHGHPEFLGAEPLYRRCYVPLADDLHALQHHVAHSHIRLLIVDSLALAAGAELEKAESAIRVFSALRTLGVSSLIVAHVPKDTDRPSIFGSVFFGNLARNVFELVKVQEAGENKIEVGLFHRKSNLGSLHRPIGLRFQFGDAIRIETMDLRNQPFLAKGLSLKRRLQHALKDGAKTAQELSEELDTDYPQVRARLNEGRGKWVCKLDQNRWGLMTTSEVGGI
jgi:hypothetical protein